MAGGDRWGGGALVNCEQCEHCCSYIDDKDASCCAVLRYLRPLLAVCAAAYNIRMQGNSEGTKTSHKKPIACKILFTQQIQSQHILHIAPACSCC